MPLKLVRRGDTPNIWMRGTVRGIKVFETCGTTDEKAAEAFRAKREWEILQSSVFGQQATATLIDAAIIYLEGGGEVRFTKKITDHFGAAPLASIDQAAIDHAARVLYPNAAPATLVRQVYAPLSVMLNRAAERGLCNAFRIRRPKLPKGRVRWLTLAEARRLIAACAPHMAPLVTFLLFTGARAGEALWLDWRNVDLRRRQVQFLDTKNGDSRGVPLHPEVIAVLKSLKHRSGMVFRRPDGKPYDGLREGDDNDRSAGTRIKTAFRAACRRAGIEDFSPHDCRHTWASWHYAKHRDLSALMHLGGWKSEKMVLRYAHLNVGHLAGSITSMPGLSARPKARQPAARQASGYVSHGRTKGLTRIHHQAPRQAQQDAV